jgi:hypothetical protein
MDDHLNSLYETDALIWTETQVALLRARKFDQWIWKTSFQNWSTGAKRQALSRKPFARLDDAFTEIPIPASTTYTKLDQHDY